MYLASAAVAAQNMATAAVSYANQAIAALSVVDSNMYSVGLNKVTYGTSVFAGPVVLARGNGYPVISMDYGGIFLYGQGSASGSPGSAGSSAPNWTASGLTSYGYVGIQFNQIGIYAPVSGGTQASVIVQGGNITLWANNGSTSYPYATLTSSNLTFYQGNGYYAQINASGFYVYAGNYTLAAYASGITLAYSGGAAAVIGSGGMTLYSVNGNTAYPYIALTSTALTFYSGGAPQVVVGSANTYGAKMILDVYSNCGRIQVLDSSLTSAVTIDASNSIYGITLYGGRGLLAAGTLAAGAGYSTLSATALVVNYVTCINSSGQFVGAGVYTPNYGVSAAGFNPYSGGAQHYGATYTLYDYNGSPHSVIGGVLVN